MTKRVLITGANSYIGTSFERYIKENYPDDFKIDTLEGLERYIHAKLAEGQVQRTVE